jgi:hypothetical protein
MKDTPKNISIDKQTLVYMHRRIRMQRKQLRILNDIIDGRKREESTSVARDRYKSIIQKYQVHLANRGTIDQWKARYLEENLFRKELMYSNLLLIFLLAVIIPITFFMVLK